MSEESGEPVEQPTEVNSLRLVVISVVTLLIVVAGTYLILRPEAEPEGKKPDASAPKAEVTSTVRIGEIAGQLGTEQRQAQLAEIQKVVDGWIDAGYVIGEYPRSDFADALAAFTPDAKQLAKADLALLTNQGLGDKLAGVQARSRDIQVDFMAPNGQAKAATARVRLELELDLADDEASRVDVIRAKLFFSKAEGAWKIFGYQVNRREQ